VEKGKVFYEKLDGSEGEETFDFAMLIPAFSGPGFTAFDKKGKDITGKLFMPNGFMKVDANYTKNRLKNGWLPTGLPLIKIPITKICLL